MALLAAMLLGALTIAPAAAVIEAEEAFYNTWARTDLPVQSGEVDRTWMWGPQPNTEVLSEPYADHPAGNRPVQYFDKSRMEVNNPNLEYDGLWYVTNGLLVVELMTGMMQVGHEEFEPHDPATVHIAGDPDRPETPTYATYATLMDTPAFAEGAVITATVDANGTVGSNDDLAQWNVTAGVLAPDTGHRTASVFWDFMTSEGPVWDWETGDITTGRLFENAYYATGLPITEAYWAYIYVNGTQKWVLTQAFERRVLTFTPDNPEGWQVEAGNVGLHYYEWRYETEPPPPPPPAEFHFMLAPLNGSGVSGSGTVTLDDGMLNVTFEAAGLEANQTHVHHIHGQPEFQQSLCPTPEAAGDDGVLRLEEGLPIYGQVMLDLAPGSEVGDDGTATFNQTFDLADVDREFTAENLPAHVVILHGMTVEGEYDPFLPVACAAILPEEGFISILSGDSVAPEPIDSPGSGFATFHIPADHTQLAFTLNVEGLEGVTMAHIHLKDGGSETGPPVLWLFQAEDMDTGITADGVIASAIVGDLDLVGPLEGEPMEALIEAILAGDTYVNVHTVANPPGEISGDMQRVSDYFDVLHEH